MNLQTTRIKASIKTVLAVVALACAFQGFAPVELAAQAKRSSLLLCSVVDKATDEPVVVEYKISDEEGNNILKGRTTPKEGLIKGVVDQGHVYTIRFSGVDILTTEDTVQIVDMGEYYIAERKLAVRMIKAGNVLMESKAFGGGASLSAEGKRDLDKLAQLLMDNRTVHVEVSVAGSGSVDEVKQYLKSKGRIVNRRIDVVKGAAGQKDEVVVKVSKVADPFN